MISSQIFNAERNGSRCLLAVVSGRNESNQLGLLALSAIENSLVRTFSENDAASPVRRTHSDIEISHDLLNEKQ